jgi:flagellar motor switch protein FliG
VLTGPERAVVFLLSLDEKIAGPIVAELTDAELKKLRAVASTMRQVEAAALDETYTEFVTRSSQSVAVPRGGLRYLRRLAASAVGEERARGVFEDGVTSPLARLEAAPPDALATLLAREPTQLAAAIIAKLEPTAAAAILAAMSPDRQLAIIARVSELTELPASVLEEVASALVAELPASDGAAIGVNGLARAADILKNSGKAAAQSLVASLEVDHAELSRKLKLAMFTIDDLAKLSPRSMRTLLKEIPPDRLTMALKGAPPELASAVFAAMSARAADVLKDDLEVLGAVRKSDLEAARNEIIEIALRLEADAGLDLGRGEE